VLEAWRWTIGLISGSAVRTISVWMLFDASTVIVVKFCRVVQIG
jgi:hypothetical protein